MKKNILLSVGLFAAGFITGVVGTLGYIILGEKDWDNGEFAWEDDLK